MKEVSIVIPCYNEEAAISIYYQEMKKVLSGMKVSWELIFVDDGSNDQTIKILRKLAAKDTACRYLSYSRNFGKEAALYAGYLSGIREYLDQGSIGSVNIVSFLSTFDSYFIKQKISVQTLPHN